MSENYTILAVDDTTESLALLGQILTSAGYKVRQADSGELALAAATARPPDLILLDIRMPGLDGLEVCRQLKSRAETRAIPVILLSAAAEVRDWVEGLKSGAADFISKPFQADELLSRVRTHLVVGQARALAEKTQSLLLDNSLLETEIARRKQAESELRQSLEVAERSRVELLSALEQRRQAETELEKREERLRTILQTAIDGFWRIDRQGRLLEVNGAYCRMSGYSERELLGANVSDLEDVETAAEIAAHIQKIVECGAGRFESRHRRKDGSTFPLEITVQYQPVDGGQMVAFLCDITERKRAEEQLRKQAALLDSANDAIYVRLLDHTVTYWNEGAARLYGWAAAEAVGRKITEMGLVDAAAFASAHATLLLQGNWTGEMKKAGKDGKERVVFCRWTLLRDEHDQPREVLAINTDFTEKKQLESQYLRAQRMEGIGLLAGGIAHDLNNILTPILMSSSLLRQAVHDAESRQLLTSVHASAQRGADIIRQLLTFARGRPGVRAPVPVRQLLRELEKLIGETFPRNLRLAVTVPMELWPIIGDATQIHQALMNLCVNARDAMPEGGTLTLAAENLDLDAASAALMPGAKPGPHVCLRVTDTGSGITTEQLEHIFDPFFTTKEIGQGTGLGLPTVLGIVRGHGGSVRVQSRVAEGTTFELCLPAAPEMKTAGTPARQVMPRGHDECILVVEDEATVRDAARAVLTRHGYRVLTATEGAEALVIFTQHRTEIKAVLTDMMMPGMDGPRLVRALRQLDAHLPILGMTGLVERTAIKGLAGLEWLPMLAKPFEVEKLLVTLHQTLATANPTTDPAAG